MKVTSMIADDLINDGKAYTQSPAITKAVTAALTDGIALYNIKELNQKIAREPIFLENGRKIREINRQK